MDTIFGLNYNTLDMSLKYTYEDIENSNHLNKIKSKENQNIFVIDLYLSEDIINFIKEEENNHIVDDDFMEIKKHILYKNNKVILKIKLVDINEANKIKINGRQTKEGSNSIIVVNDEVNFDLLDNFFKQYGEYIEFRRVLNGSIKSNYYPIFKLVFFNSKIYSYTCDKNIIFKKIEEKKVG
jgi:hypothetical protein